MEVYIKADTPYISYFKNIAGFKLSIGRGDGSGVLDVVSKDRQTKFNAKSELQSFATSKETEQKIAEFIELESGTGDAKRYTVTNVDGFLYGGSKTGAVYLTAKNTEDITNIFEKINLIVVSVGNNYDANTYDGDCKETVQEYIPIKANNADGNDITLNKCGKYRLEYINGYGRFQ